MSINRIPMTITAYSLCVVCGKSHRRGSELFKLHYEANSKHYGPWKPLEETPTPIEDKHAKRRTRNDN